MLLPTLLNFHQPGSMALALGFEQRVRLFCSRSGEAQGGIPF